MVEKKETIYYCHLDSSMSLEDNNLQLYSLEKAAEEWNELVLKINELGIEGVYNLKEQLAFITNCLGLSLSQLIGQNAPSSNKKRIEPPSKLFPILLKETDSDDMTQKRLKSIFDDFLNYYDDIRHFGKTKYNSIDLLTLEKLNDFRSMTIEIWDLFISKYRKNEKNDIEEFSSIGDIVRFEELTKKARQ